MDTLDFKKEEFSKNVWNHAADPFQMSFDDRPPLPEDEVEAIQDVISIVFSYDDPAEAAKVLAPILEEDSILLTQCLQLVGLTRNKIIQDLKAATRNGTVSVRVPSTYKKLPCSNAWDYAGPYLTTKLRSVFLPFAANLDDLGAVIESLNQATWPGFIRQERAKRSGHEAEFRLAGLHLACGLPFEPEEKARNPLCRDILIGDVSFDLVVPSGAKPMVCIKSTVHTSNIGQYGESKDHLEIDEAQRFLDSSFSSAERPLLLAFIDGVGFESNRAGLNGVLEKADEFCQFRTIWKTIMISATKLEKSMTFVIPKASIGYHEGFLSRHLGSNVLVELEGHQLSGDEIEAGEALIIP